LCAPWFKTLCITIGDNMRNKKVLRALIFSFVVSAHSTYAMNMKAEWETALEEGAFLYKIFTESNYEKLRKDGFSPSEFDLIDGPKVHLSLGTKWHAIQQQYFEGKRVWVVKFQPDEIISDLKFERKRADGDFCMSHPINNLGRFNNIKDAELLEKIE